MRNVKLLVLTAISLLGWAAFTPALDAPHDGSFTGSAVDCYTCHKLHASNGGTLLGDTFTTNNDACLTCHDRGIADVPNPNTFFGSAWSTGRQAVPGTSGDQHKWSGSAVNPAAGADTPLNSALSANLLGGNLQCAVCHDTHGVRTTVSIQKGYAPNSAHASLLLNTNYGRAAPVGTSSARMKLIAYADADPAGYRIRVTSPGNLVYSTNFKTASPTWSASIPFTVGDTPANDVTLSTTGPLKIRFTVAPAANEEWAFYVSYPFLAVSNVDDAMCLDCHRSRHQSYENVEGKGSIVGTGAPIVLGTTVFSHPVGQALNANGKSYDLATPLDADGSSADSNPSNDVKLVNGVVNCTSCHAPHNASSNSLSSEVR